MEPLPLRTPEKRKGRQVRVMMGGQEGKLPFSSFPKGGNTGNFQHLVAEQSPTNNIDNIMIILAADQQLYSVAEWPMVSETACMHA